LKIQTHQDLEVFRLSFDTAMEIFKITKSFPKEERYSLTDQIRRSSRSVSSNIAEAFRKRRYEKAFISKLSDSEGEAAETQVWLEFSINCDYIDDNTYKDLFDKYDHIIAMLVTMIRTSSKWTFESSK